MRIDDAILKVVATLSRATSEETLLSEIANEVHEVAAAESCDILLRESGDALVQRASTHSPEYIRRLTLGKAVGLCGKVFTSGHPLYVPADATNHPDFAHYPGAEERSHFS